MLSEPKLKLLNDFVQTASIDELIYALGFIDGYRLKDTDRAKAIAPALDLIAVKPTIVYATETGNAKKVATQLLARFKKQKINARSVDIQQFNLGKIGKDEPLLFVISTQGDGDLPASAAAWYQELSVSETDLAGLSYAIFGLGDTSYPLFCNAAVMLEQALQAKGAQALLPTVKADLDYSSLFNDWQLTLMACLQGNAPKPGPQSIPAPVAATGKTYHTAAITHKVVLNDHGSNKTTYHIEIETEAEVQYQPGDALGIVPVNNARDINAVLEYFDKKADTIFERESQSTTAYQWLEQLNIKGLSKRNAAHVAVLFNQPGEVGQADLLDLIKGFEPGLKPRFEDLLRVLSPVLPRLYSISSAREAHAGQVHLTLNLHTFKVGEELRYGLASDYLAAMKPGQSFECYIQPNHHFRLPADDKDIIMIGPGTGIAPFRSFLAERDVRGAGGRNWLFFGEQHFVADFYYQTEIQEWLSTGILSKLSTAFSRDQAEKIYVQDRIRENAALFNEWLTAGAYIYICGQKLPMSRDVEQTILDVLQEQRNIDEAEARTVLEDMEMNGRYLKDVY